jgi:simple sugar transport system ATP-binding protein
MTKIFGSFAALEDVSIKIRPGSFHALLGENGAGKSTLVKCMMGFYKPTRGSLLIDGREVEVATPRDAHASGLGMVYQHFTLIPSLTAAENLVTARRHVPTVIDWRAERRGLEEFLAKMPFRVRLDSKVSDLAAGEKQKLEILKQIYLDCRFLILDEPTSVLTPQEVHRLFETLRLLAAEGCSILYISHKLHEIKALCHTATILRGGKVVATCDPRAETAKSMAQLMIGAEIRTLSRRTGQGGGEPRLAVGNLDLPGDGPFGTTLKDVSFEVRRGEIFGIAGVAGNGQHELFQALSGERLAASTEMVLIDGRPAGRMDAGGRRRLGMCCVPEERNGHGAVPDMSLVENAVLSGRQRKRLTASGFIRRPAAESFATTIIREFDVRTPGAEATARSLSGGNLQKFIVGREVLQDPGILIVFQPTWGVDAGAATAIHQALFNLASGGAAVLIVSQDLDELLTLSDRLAVINVGVLSGAMVTAEASLDEIGLLMGGLHGMAEHVPQHEGGIAHVA